LPGILARTRRSIAPLARTHYRAARVYNATRVRITKPQLFSRRYSPPRICRRQLVYVHLGALPLPPHRCMPSLPLPSPPLPPPPAAACARLSHARTFASARYRLSLNTMPRIFEFNITTARTLPRVLRDNTAARAKTAHAVLLPLHQLTDCHLPGIPAPSPVWTQHAYSTDAGFLTAPAPRLRGIRARAVGLRQTTLANTARHLLRYLPLRFAPASRALSRKDSIFCYAWILLRAFHARTPPLRYPPPRLLWFHLFTAAVPWLVPCTATHTTHAYHRFPHLSSLAAAAYASSRPPPRALLPLRLVTTAHSLLHTLTPRTPPLPTPASFHTLVHGRFRGLVPTPLPAGFCHGRFIHY